MKQKIEILAPAKNLIQGIAAINAGADAVYIGAPLFGARTNATNSIDDIAEMVRYAHLFKAQVFVVINTILYDDELKTCRDMIYKLYDIGVDAIIIQDMAILEMDLPPIVLHASTQANNRDPKHVKFLKDAGIKRVLLARELNLDQIKEIHEATDAELEFFVSGALCVSFSGNCYMSIANGERSANRGSCAQNCRLPYELIDGTGKTLIQTSHLLSIKDLDLSDQLPALIEAGISSFKIEGRLKDIVYVKNNTSYLRKRLDDFLENNDDKYQKASSGRAFYNFEPKMDRSFNRGYTDYFVNNRKEKIGSWDTPKSQGQYIGKVLEIKANGYVIENYEQLNNADGLYFINAKGEADGAQINIIKWGSAQASRIIHVTLSIARPVRGPQRSSISSLMILLVLDESHVSVSQIGGMSEGDRSRKTVLVDHGFRLPSALDNRPLNFLEFQAIQTQTIYVSATPAPRELGWARASAGASAVDPAGYTHTSQRIGSLPGVAELVVRPTGLIDPRVTIKPLKGQIDDLIEEVRKRADLKERILVTTLTKRTAEELTDYLRDIGVNVRYLHSEIDAIERVEILRALRKGEFDVLVGINLLREGLDLPEVSLVAILDADKEGFLRSETSLIQTAGRAARHLNGEVILYADVMTDSIKKFLAVTEYRRNRQIAYNKEHDITPRSVRRAVEESLSTNAHQYDSKAVAILRDAGGHFDVTRIGTSGPSTSTMRLSMREASAG